MHDFNLRKLPLLSSLTITAALVGACGDDGSDETLGSSTTVMTTGPAPTGTASATEPTTTTTGPATTSATESDTTQTTSDPTGDNAFVFDQTAPEDMIQLDRMGMPGVATAVISADVKDMYNEGTPEADFASAFVADIVKNVTALHAALDDDLTTAGLTACAAEACVAQGAPLVVPDTLQIDPGKPATFPNGRKLEDPVIDITLAVLLLDLKTHSADTLAKLPLNPTSNDKGFLADFPYLAEPHQ